MQTKHKYQMKGKKMQVKHRGQAGSIDQEREALNNFSTPFRGYGRSHSQPLISAHPLIVPIRYQQLLCVIFRRVITNSTSTFPLIVTKKYQKLSFHFMFCVISWRNMTNFHFEVTVGPKDNHLWISGHPLIVIGRMSKAIYAHVLRVSFRMKMTYSILWLWLVAQTTT